MCETTALGVAIAAGNADGIRKWDLKLDIAVPSDIFLPSISENGMLLIFPNFYLIFNLLKIIKFYLERDILYSQWKMAIDRSLGWEPVSNTNGMFFFFFSIKIDFVKLSKTSDHFFVDNIKNIHKATAPGIFMISTLLLLMIAKYHSML